MNDPQLVALGVAAFLAIVIPVMWKCGVFTNLFSQDKEEDDDTTPYDMDDVLQAYHH